MKMKIYLDTDGQENLATGKTVWPWNFVTRTEDDAKPPKLGILVGECEIALPSKEVCIGPVLEVLKEREQAINAEAYKDLAAIKERRDNLLALTFEGTSS